MQESYIQLTLIVSFLFWMMHFGLSLSSWILSGFTAYENIFSINKTNFDYRTRKTINCTNMHESAVVSAINSSLSFVINIILYIIAGILCYYILNFVNEQDEEKGANVVSLKKNVYAPHRANNQTSVYSENPNEQGRLLTGDQLSKYQTVTDTPSGAS